MSHDRILRRRTTVVLVAIGALALTLRLWSIDYGLPGIFNMDEKPILDRALTFAKGDPNPRNFLYPTLYLYALFAWQGAFFAFGWLSGWFQSAADFQTRYFTDPSAHILAGRVLTALAGAACIGAVYWFGTRLYNRVVGIGAALFLAVAPLAVRDAHYIKLDIPVTFFTILAHAALAAIVIDPERAATRRSWLLAGYLAGLAISTQYYAAFLAFPFVVTALIQARRSGAWGQSVRLLLWGGLATLAGFITGSPFFFFEPAVIIRDFTELREVDIDRAVQSGLFSSAGHYARLLFGGALGLPVAVLALLGMVLSLWRETARGLLLVTFPIAFLAFVSNTFPASRYLNIVLPSFVVAAGCGAWYAGTLMKRHARLSTAVLMVLAGSVSLADSVRWNRFFAQDDTRIQALAFIEQNVPAGSTVAVQPYSAPITRSHDSLREALESRLGDVALAPVKYRLELEAPLRPGPSYRVIYLGASGKTQAPPADVDKIYISPYAVDEQTRLGCLYDAGVEYVVLTRYGAPPVAFESLTAILRRDARQIAAFTPYEAGVDPDSAPVPPFRHNGNTWIHPALERPGPIVEIWQLERDVRRAQARPHEPEAR
ncbi:MAG TPA: glycosyltransferase family 39 protein [Vicinamibacterales bacterium]